MYEACARVARSCSSETNATGGEPPSVCAYTRLTARFLTTIGTTTTSSGGGSAPSASHSLVSIDLAGEGGGPMYATFVSCAACSADAPPTRPKVAFEDLSLPLGGASALQAAHDTNVPFVGPPPSPAKPVEIRLWDALGAEPPPVEVVVVPILVKNRAVNLVYAHTLGGAPPLSFVTELQDMAARAQASYTRLIRQTRGS